MPILKDTLRTFALDNSPESYLALGYSSGRISIFSAENDHTLKLANFFIFLNLLF